MAKTNAQGQGGGANPAPGSQPAGPPPGGNDTQGQVNQNPGNQNPQGTDNQPGEGPQADGGKVKIVHDRLRNGKIFLSDGSIAEFNAEGIAEIELTEAARLLSIPGYKKA
jgi:hypothetical protein